MRGLGATAVLLAALAGCTGTAATRPRDPAVCAALFDDYATAAWLYPNNRVAINDDDSMVIIPAALDRPTRLLRNNGCLTLSSDIDGMPALAERLSPHAVTDSGAPIPAATVQVGVVLSIYDEGRATQFFRGLGYRSRGIGAPALGRLLYIGPFTSQGALDEAMSIAREAGFIAPIVARHTKF